MKIDHLSVSQMNMFSRCGVQYMYRYCEGIKAPPGIALHVGGSTHKARELILRAKMVGTIPPVEAAREEAAAQCASGINTEVALDDKEKAIGIDTVRGAAIDQAVALATLDYGHNLTALVPVKIEHKVELDLTAIGCKLVGIIDTIDAAGVIRDLKTAGKSLTQKDADTSMQLTMYSMMQRLSEGVDETAVQLDVLVKTKTPKAQNLISHRDVDDIQVLLNRIARIKEGIEKECWTPASEGSFWCSPKLCGYFDRCPYAVRRVTVTVAVEE